MAFLNMTLRGLILSLSLVCFFFQSEAERPSEPSALVMVAVFGSFAIIGFGLLVDTTLGLNSDKSVVVILLAIGAVCFAVCVGLSAREYYETPPSIGYVQQSTHIEINKSILSSICVILLLCDIGLLLNANK